MIFFGWVFFLISLGSPHVRPMGVHRTCEEPNDFELTATGVELDASRRVHGVVAEERGARLGAHHRTACCRVAR